MMFAILVLCLVGLTAAQAPVPCITPQQWEARVFEMNEAERFFVRARLTYDSVYHRQRIMEEVDVGRDDDFFDVIRLFDSNIEYAYNFRARNCTRRPLGRPWRDFGIRPNSTSVGEAYVGTSAVPSAGLLASLWINNHTTPMNDTVRTFGTWTYLACLPVRFIDHSSLYGRTEISFYDITVGIHDPSVFIPRRECLTDEEYAMRHVLFGNTPKKSISK